MGGITDGLTGPLQIFQMATSVVLVLTFSLVDLHSILVSLVTPLCSMLSSCIESSQNNALVFDTSEVKT